MHSHDLGRRHAALDGLIEGRGGDPAFLRDAATILGLAETGPLLCVVAPVEPSGEDPLRAPQECLAAHGITSVWFLRPPTRSGSSRWVRSVRAPARPGWRSTRRAAARSAASASPRSSTASPPSTPGTGWRSPPPAHSPAPASPGSTTGCPRRCSSTARSWRRGWWRRPSGGCSTCRPPTATPLLTTLEELLACGGSPTHAASALFCHRNTVIYRMRRIEAVTGRRLGDIRDRLLRTLGLMAARRPS